MSDKVKDVLNAARALDGAKPEQRAEGVEKLKQMFNALTPEEKEDYLRQAAKRKVNATDPLASLPKDDGMMGDKYT